MKHTCSYDWLSSHESKIYVLGTEPHLYPVKKRQLGRFPLYYLGTVVVDYKKNFGERRIKQNKWHKSERLTSQYHTKRVIYIIYFDLTCIFYREQSLSIARRKFADCMLDGYVV